MRVLWPLLVALLTTCSTRLAAQEYTVSLAGKQMNFKNFPYYVVQVTDARTQDYCLGIAQVGPNHRRVPVFSKDSLTAELAGLFARSLGGDTTGRHPLVVRINHLFVYETMVSSEQEAFLEISLSFLQVLPDGRYLELATIGATSRRSSSLDVSSKHDDNIISGIYDCLATLRERADRGVHSLRLVPASELYRPPTPSSFPIMKTGPNQAGVFQTFSDFLYNTPQQVAGLSVVLVRVPKAERGVQYRLERESQLLGNRNIWGVSDGNHAYAVIFGDYYRLERAGDSLLVMAPGPASSDEALTGAVIGGLLGGVVGGAIGGAIGGAVAEDKAGPPTRFQVDLLTSSLTPVNLPNARRVEARVVLFCSEFANAPITVRLNGRELCTLEKGTYHRLRLPPPAEAFTLTLEANGKTAEAKVQPAMFATELCLLRIVKGAPRLDQPDGETRRKLLRQIADEQVVEGCKQ